MTDQEIIDNVNIIVHAYTKKLKINSEEKMIISSVVGLIVNLLQNINTIANNSDKL